MLIGSTLFFHTDSCGTFHVYYGGQSAKISGMDLNVKYVK